MTPTARATRCLPTHVRTASADVRSRGLLTFLLFALAVLGGLAAPGAAAASTGRTSVGPSVGSVPSAVRAGATNPAGSAAAAGLVEARSTTLATLEPISVSTALPVTSNSPVSPFIAGLPSRHGSSLDAAVVRLPGSVLGAASAAGPSPAAARAPPAVA